jgi:hypothetical protein
MFRGFVLLPSQGTLLLYGIGVVNLLIGCPVGPGSTPNVATNVETKSRHKVTTNLLNTSGANPLNVLYIKRISENRQRSI